MWIFTETGFISAVELRDDPSKLMVRARDKKSLEKLSQDNGIDVITTTYTDYPYRIILDREAVVSFIKESVDNLHYFNFKNRVKETRGYDYAHMLGNVWYDMLEATKLESEENKI